MSTPQEAMFNEALSAIQSGDRTRARDLLTRLLKIGQDNPEYWVWMSAVVDTPKERLFCLKEAARLDPQNAAAHRGLILLGAQPPDSAQVMPARLQKRNWAAHMAGIEGLDQGQVQAPPKVQFALMGAALLVVLGLIGFAIWGAQQQQNRVKRPLVINFPTDTVVAADATTPTAPAAAVVISGSPTPLWMLLKATYTPTPLYANTPHARSENYRLGMRDFQRGDWASAVRNFQQVLKDEPNAIDVQFYLGEAYRQQGDLSQATQVFNQVIKQNPDFAPPYLGRSRVTLMANPKNNESAMKDVKLALEKDPKYGEAYLEMAKLQIRLKQTKDALQSLDEAANIMPDSPLVYFYRAQIYVALKDPKQALENAQKANELDITLVEAYRMVGEALQATGDIAGSARSLNTYLTYRPDDADAWAMLAKANLETGDPKAARKALDKAIQLDKTQIEAYLLRGQLLLVQKDAEGALDDFKVVLRSQSDSYEASLGTGIALMDLNYPGDAYNRFEGTKALAETDIQKAEVLYWTAQSLDKLGEQEVALRYYQKLVAMPADSVKPEWSQLANSRITALIKLTPSATPKSPTRTLTATPTPKATDTRQPTQTKVPTATRQPTATAKP